MPSKKVGASGGQGIQANNGRPPTLLKAFQLAQSSARALLLCWFGADIMEGPRCVRVRLDG
jgi:hypothetical protein